jgi:hypothetical protein
MAVRVEVASVQVCLRFGNPFVHLKESVMKFKSLVFCGLLSACGGNPSEESHVKGVDGSLVNPTGVKLEHHEETLVFDGYELLWGVKADVDTAVKNHLAAKTNGESDSCWYFKVKATAVKTFITHDNAVVADSISYSIQDETIDRDILYFLDDCAKAIRSEISYQLYSIEDHSLTRRLRLAEVPASQDLDTRSDIAVYKVLLADVTKEVLLGAISVDHFMDQVKLIHLCGLVSDKTDFAAVAEASISDLNCNIRTDFDGTTLNRILDIEPTYLELTEDTQTLNGVLTKIDIFGRGTIKLINGEQVDLLMGAKFVAEANDLSQYVGKKVNVNGFFTNFSAADKTFVYEALGIIQ